MKKDRGQFELESKKGNVSTILKQEFWNSKRKEKEGGKKRGKRGTKNRGRLNNRLV